jgi:DNA processing protein
MSSYAQEVLEKLFSHLAQYRIATVSGMATGVDSLCHKLSIRHQIPTVAVLGGGLGYFLKSNKRAKLDAIVGAGGLVLSEYHWDQSPTVWTYPHRNRLIAILSDVLFVPEAGEKS